MDNKWIKSPFWDLLFFICPLIIPIMVGVVLQQYDLVPKNIPNWMWLLIIPILDVGHVWSTLFRTYLSPAETKGHEVLFYSVPIIILFISILIFSYSYVVFWQLLTYIAIFHFVRQQYGILMIYGGRSLIDKVAIYSVTIIPILYWHSVPKQFDWFVKDGFVVKFPHGFSKVLLVVYIFIFIFYTLNEIKNIANKKFNLPKNLWLLGTASSWGVGIVIWDNDFLFTLSNVLSHGIPYIALVYIYSINRYKRTSEKLYFNLSGLFDSFKVKKILMFLGIVFLIGYTEELLWDAFLWQEHQEIFMADYNGYFNRLFVYLGDLATNNDVLAIIVPMLTLPQLTHYFVDGFIWKYKYSGQDIRGV